LLAEIDQKISAQVDEVLQHPTVQQLEAAWAGLRYLVDHVDFDENVRVALVNCSKEDLAHDFDQAIDVTVSGLYRRLCEPEHHPSDGAAFSLIVADYELDHHQQDVELLRHCAAAAADAHAPLIANASPRFFGCEGFDELAPLGDLASVFESPRYAPWESFRSSEDARYVALCASGDASLGGPVSHAFAVEVADTFAKRRWFDMLTEVEGLGALETDPGLSERQMHDLSAQGIVVLRHRGDGTAAAFSVSSTQRPKRFADTAEGRALALDSLAGAQLTNVLNISRVAHFIEALGRKLGMSQGASSLEQALQAWLREQVPSASIRVSEGDYYRYELELHAASPQSDATLRVAGTLGNA
jgi:type VI secretion system protein ImpC